MADQWLAAVREELGELESFRVPLAVLRTAAERSLKVDAQFRVEGLAEAGHRWLEEIEQRVFATLGDRDLIVFVHNHRMKLNTPFFNSRHLLLQVLSDSAAAAVLQGAYTASGEPDFGSRAESESECSTATAARRRSSSCSSDSSWDSPPAGALDPEFTRQFEAMAVQEALRLEDELAGRATIAPVAAHEVNLTVIKVLKSLELSRRPIWKCLVRDTDQLLAVELAVPDHALQKTLTVDVVARAALTAALKEYIKQTRSARAMGLVEVDLLQTADGRFWTIGVTPCPAAAFEEPSDVLRVEDPQDSVFDALFRRELTSGGATSSCW